MDFMKASLEGTTIEQIVNGYDWKGLGAGTVVDVRDSNTLPLCSHTDIIRSAAP